MRFDGFEDLNGAESMQHFDDPESPDMVDFV